MVKVGILICDRNRACTGNKCFMSIRERDGAFAQYRADESVEVVGFIACGGCPGESLEFSRADMKKYGAEVIHLATCFLAGYPPCPYIKDFTQYIESVVGLPVVVGTHPMPQNYIDAHEKAGDWKGENIQNHLKKLVENKEASHKYDSTQPDFLKTLRA